MSGLRGLSSLSSVSSQGNQRLGALVSWRKKDEGPVSGLLLMVRYVVSSSDYVLSPMAQSPLHITGHNSPRLAVWGLRGAR